MAEIRFVEQGHVILDMTEDMPCSIAMAARTCYRSEGRSSHENDMRLIRSLIENGHDAMLEHAWVSVRFTTSRAVANELVRHRLFSFAQESTRYLNYDRKGFAFVLPSFEGEGLMGAHKLDCVKKACKFAVDQYDEMIACGAKPEMARAVLPLCTATEIVVSGNVREWRHMLRLRTESHAHPEMRALVTPLLLELRQRVPILFDDIEPAE